MNRRAGGNRVASRVSKRKKTQSLTSSLERFTFHDPATSRLRNLRDDNVGLDRFERFAEGGVASRANERGGAEKRTSTRGPMTTDPSASAWTVTVPTSKPLVSMLFCAAPERSVSVVPPSRGTRFSQPQAPPPPPQSAL